jgi:DNA gyrase subunit A
MTLSRNGYGKRTKVDLYRPQSRGGKGIINFRSTAKTGPVIGAMPVDDSDALLLLTSTNKIIRIGVEEIRSIGRATQGVRLVSMDEGAAVVGFARIDESGGDDTGTGPSA